MLKLREKNDEIESKKNEKKGLNQKKKRWKRSFIYHIVMMNIDINYQ